MHELSLCQHTIEIIEEQALKHRAKKVTAVWLEVGAFSCVETSALDFCFSMVCRGTLAEGCQLHLHQQEAECWCYDCQQSITLLSMQVRRCPQCQGDNLRIVADDSIQINRLEIE